MTTDPLDGNLDELARHHLRQAIAHVDAVEAVGSSYTDAQELHLRLELGRVHAIIASNLGAEAHRTEAIETSRATRAASEAVTARMGRGVARIEVICHTRDDDTDEPVHFGTTLDRVADFGLNPDQVARLRAGEPVTDDDGDTWQVL